MISRYVISILVGFCLYGGTCSGVETSSEGARDRVLAEARSLIGIRELTGNNDGEIVEAILRSAGASKGDPWCAAFNYYCYSRAGLGYLVPRSAWSPDWVANATWKQGKGREPLPGDTGGIYFESKGRVAHTFIVENWGDTVVTIEGNTNDQLSRDGDGCYRKRRLKRQIYAVRDWITGGIIMADTKWNYCAPEAEWWLNAMAKPDPGTPVRRINIYWNEDKSAGHRAIFYTRGGVSYVFDNKDGERKMSLSNADIMYPTQIAQRMYGGRAKVATWAKTPQDGVYKSK